MLGWRPTAPFEPLSFVWRAANGARQIEVATMNDNQRLEPPVSDAALDRLLREARSFNDFTAEPVGEGVPGEPLGDRRAAHVAGADVEDAERVRAGYATPLRAHGATSRSGTTSRSCSADRAPSRSRTGTLPVTSTMDEGWMPGVGPPSR